MKKKFNIEVDCANCAAKMEAAVNRLDGVNSASVNYLTQRFILDANDDIFDDILQSAIKVMKRVESDFQIEL